MFIDNDCWLKVLHLNMNIACCSIQSIIFRGIFHINVSFSVILQEIEILQWYFSLLFKLSKNYTSASLVAVVKNSPANSGDLGSIPGWGRSFGRGNGTPLQYSCLRIPWTEKPRGLQSVGLPRVRHDLASEPDHKVQQPLWQPGLRRGVGTVHTAQKTAVLAQVSGLWTQHCHL